jgi:alpha-acetolactate decarboxylase
VGHQDDGFGAILNGVLDGGESAGDTLVVGDLGVGLLVEGDVEVDLEGLSSVWCVAWD